MEREQLVAAETHCAGAVDADSLDGVNTGSVIEPCVAEKAFDVVAPWLRMEFTGFTSRDGLNRKPSIPTFPKQRGDPGLRM